MISTIKMFSYDDLLLVPICLGLLYLLSYFKARKYTATFQRYFWWALSLKLFFNFVYAIILVFYYGNGDSYTYYKATIDMHNAVLGDISYLKDIFLHLGITSDDRLYYYFAYNDNDNRLTQYTMVSYDNLMLPKLSLLFSFLFKKSYLCISICISYFAFAGSWRMFKAFYHLYPILHRKIAVATLFLPSILFWGTGLLKDPVCFGSLGFTVYACYQVFIKKEKILVSIFILLLTSWLIFIMKPYIILSFLCVLPIWLFLHQTKRIKRVLLRNVVNVMSMVIAIVLFGVIFQQLTQTEVANMFSYENFLKSVQMQQVNISRSEAGSTFSLGNFDGSLGGFIQMFPIAIATTLFRPFLWEVRNPLMLFSAFESFLFIVLTVMAFWMAGLKGFFKILFSDSFLIFCLAYSLIFAGAVGITTFNFGSLARYKIPALPFYLIMLFVIMHRSGKSDPKYIFSSRIF